MHLECLVNDLPSLFFISDKSEPANNPEQQSVQQMEVDGTKIIEKRDEELLKSKDTNDEIVKFEVENSCENVVDVLPESKDGKIPEDEAKKQLDVDKISEQECCADESPVGDNALGSNTQNIPGQSDKQPSSNVASKPLDVSEEPEACKENSCDVRVDRDNIGALGFLMDYESPVSSPAASPVPEMDFEEISVTPGKLR